MTATAGQELVMRAAGDVDIAVVTRLRAEWYAAVEALRPDRLVVDLGEVTFLDAAGLGLLVGLQKRQRGHDGSLVLVDTPPFVRRLLRLTGLEASLLTP